MYVRWSESGATYFFTVVTFRRQRIPPGRLLQRHYASRLTMKSPIFCLTRHVLGRILHVTHLPRLSPVRVTRIKGRFFYCAQLGEGA